MKDIFIDNNVAKNFANPLDPEYKKLIRWLWAYDGDRENCAYLVVSQKLVTEYIGTCGTAYSGTSMPAILDRLTRDKRLLKIKKKQIDDFKRAHFKKHICKKLTCSWKDRDHIPVVLLSHRKYAVTIDDNFFYDLVNFPGFTVFAAKRPEDLPYDR